MKKTEFKTYSQCCHDVAVKHGLGTTLVTGHKASYFTEAHDLFINQFTPSELEAMAMKEFPVKMESIRNIRGYFDVDKNIEPRDIFLSGLQAYHKMMGGQEG